jgi:hypothetical protein
VGIQVPGPGLQQVVHPACNGEPGAAVAGCLRPMVYISKGKVSSLHLLAITWTAFSDAPGPAAGSEAAVRPRPAAAVTRAFSVPWDDGFKFLGPTLIKKLSRYGLQEPKNVNPNHSF